MQNNRNSEKHAEMVQFLSTHTSDSLKATIVTISVFNSDPGYDYKLKYFHAL